jgi:hypothetical protein
MNVSDISAENKEYSKATLRIEIRPPINARPSKIETGAYDSSRI